jgi:hypothetical protein
MRPGRLCCTGARTGPEFGPHRKSDRRRGVEHRASAKSNNGTLAVNVEKIRQWPGATGERTPRITSAHDESDARQRMLGREPRIHQRHLSLQDRNASLATPWQSREQLRAEIAPIMLATPITSYEHQPCRLLWRKPASV